MGVHHQQTKHSQIEENQYSLQLSSIMKLLAIFATFTAFASAGKLPNVALNKANTKKLNNLKNNAQTKLEAKLGEHDINLNLNEKFTNLGKAASPQIDNIKTVAGNKRSALLKEHGNKNVNQIIGEIAGLANGAIDANAPKVDLAQSFFQIGKDLFNAGVKAGQAQVTKNKLNGKVNLFEKRIVKTVNKQLNSKVVNGALSNANQKVQQFGN